MKKIKLLNDIHNTETLINAEIWETTLAEKIATASQKELARAGRVLCGMDDCSCGGWRGKGVDEDGLEYSIAVD